jgi:hypothetical protein
MIIVCKELDLENPMGQFWARVRFDKERGYAPAGQVNPPPQPKKAPSPALPGAVRDIPHANR